MSPRQPVEGKLRSLARYGFATAGPIGGAGAQFLLALLLLHGLPAEDFGRFSFLLVASQLGLGLWGALFCAPMATLTADGRREDVQALFATSLGATMAAFVVFYLIGIGVGATSDASLLFAAFAALSLLRWLARTRAFVVGESLRTIISDGVYAASLLAGTVVIWIAGETSFRDAFTILLVAAILALLPLGKRWLADQFGRLSLAGCRRYRNVWHEHSRWAVLGALTTEATANAHVYIVTFAYGPAAYALIAATVLLIRPIQVVQNALGEFERARMGRQLGAGDLTGALASARLFRFALGLAWLATAALTMSLFAYDPGLVFPAEYAPSMLAAGCALWLVTALVRLLRTPESTLLQAAGQFRLLAHASVISAGWSILAVIALLAFAGPLWSIAGIAIGEMIFALWIWRQTGRWRAEIGAHRYIDGKPACP